MWCHPSSSLPAVSNPLFVSFSKTVRLGEASRRGGWDTAGKEEEGWHHTDFYLSRPADETKSPLETLLAPVPVATVGGASTLAYAPLRRGNPRRGGGSFVEPLKLVLSIILLPLVVLLLQGPDTRNEQPNIPAPLSRRVNDEI